MKYVFILLLLLNSSHVFSLQWPVENPELKAAFAEKRGSSYNTGIDIGGREQPVLAVADGEIVYYHEENNNFSAIPSGLGNFIILEHDRQLRTVYAFLKNDSIKSNKYKVSAGEIIAETGDSGSASGQHLHFEVIDLELNEIINPLILIPAAKDKTKPVLREVFIKDTKNNEYRSLSGRNELKSGRFEISAVIYDTSEFNKYLYQIAPYKINLFINGEEAASLVYNSIKKSGNSLVLSSNLKTADEFYIEESDWQIILGDFDIKPGTSRIEISAGDYAGNETVREFLVISQ